MANDARPAGRGKGPEAELLELSERTRHAAFGFDPDTARIRADVECLAPQIAARANALIQELCTANTRRDLPLPEARDRHDRLLALRTALGKLMSAAGQIPPELLGDLTGLLIDAVGPRGVHLSNLIHPLRRWPERDQAQRRQMQRDGEIDGPALVAQKLDASSKRWTGHIERSGTRLLPQGVEGEPDRDRYVSVAIEALRCGPPLLPECWESSVGRLHLMIEEVETAAEGRSLQIMQDVARKAADWMCPSWAIASMAMATSAARRGAGSAAAQAVAPLGMTIGAMVSPRAFLGTAGGDVWLALHRWQRMSPPKYTDLEQALAELVSSEPSEEQAADQRAPDCGTAPPPSTDPPDPPRRETDAERIAGQERRIAQAIAELVDENAGANPTQVAVAKRIGLSKQTVSRRVKEPRTDALIEQVPNLRGRSVRVTRGDTHSASSGGDPAELAAAEERQRAALALIPGEDVRSLAERLLSEDDSLTAREKRRAHSAYSQALLTLNEAS